jgi:F-type H+-transporting ATPase subunit a
MNNPLEQFAVISLTNNTGWMIFSITNTAILFIITLLLLLSIYIFTSTPMIIPSYYSLIIESYLATLLGIVIDQLGKMGDNESNTDLRTTTEQGRKRISMGGQLYPLITSLFTLILISNMLGMVPYSFTTTAHISVTLGLSITIMIGITLIGFSVHQLNYLSLFIPKGTPLILIPLLVLIELISYTARAFSLALRLTANVSAGHCLLGVISMLTITAATTLITYQGIIISIPFIILIPLYGLELLVALLQSYVFTLLICSYTADILNMSSHH